MSKCKGIQRVLSPSCAVSFALLSLVLVSQPRTRLPLSSSTGTLGCGGFEGCAAPCCREVGDLRVIEPKLSSHATCPRLVTLGWVLAGDRGVAALCSSSPLAHPLPELCYLSKLLAGKIDVCKALSLRPSWNSCQRCNPT